MPDDLGLSTQRATPPGDRPLLGLTVLVVEDSRYASEAVRLLCLRSGARIRRADCLRSARRHLAAYRPDVVIVDMGLPDGSGGDLIAELAAASPRVPVLMGTSGDPGAEDQALGAGADGFLAKPVLSLGHFQQALLTALPPSARPRGLRALPDEMIAPDPLSLRDDLAHAAEVLADDATGAALGYIAQFLSGVARTAQDDPLADAAEALAGSQRTGTGRPDLAHIRSLVSARLALAGGI